MSTAEASERLHLDYQLAAGVAVVTVTGEVDVATCELLRDGLLRVVTANSAAVPLAAIYQVRRAPKPLPGVSLELAVWSGNELTHIPTPDPADLPSIAADPIPETAASEDLLPMP
jgi:hypothetical protein